MIKQTAEFTYEKIGYCPKVLKRWKKEIEHFGNVSFTYNTELQTKH